MFFSPARPALTEPQAQRLRDWRRRARAIPQQSLMTGRFVVVDVESTGLDMGRDRLIAMGACAIHGGRIVMADSFEVVLRQDQVSSKENILVHGIGGVRQRQGVDPREALLDFLEYLGAAPLLAFHAAFDQGMIERAMRTFLGERFVHPWVDLAYVMPELIPERGRHYRSLDDWTGHFGITNTARHNALADAMATAQLMLAALPLARLARAERYDQLQAMERARHWFART